MVERGAPIFFYLPQMRRLLAKTNCPPGHTVAQAGRNPPRRALQDHISPHGDQSDHNPSPHKDKPQHIHHSRCTPLIDFNNTSFWMLCYGFWIDWHALTQAGRSQCWQDRVRKSRPGLS